MVRPLTWVLVGIVAYTVGAMALRSRGLLPSFVRVQGPITTIHTKHGRAVLDWLASPRRFWRAWGNLGVGAALVVMVVTFLATLSSGVQSIRQPTAGPIRNPQNVLVIPGVNDFLPLSAAPEIVAGLLIGLVVHEGGHGLLCRVENIDIDSMGVALFTVIPVGAFVEPSEESRDRADRGSQTRMFAAGVTNNFAIAVLSFLLLFGPVAGSIAVVDGVPVGDTVTGSAAARAGIGHGDVITRVNGTRIHDERSFERELDRVDGTHVAVGLESGETVTVERSLLVTRAVADVLPGIPLRRGQPLRVVSINGTAVDTEQAFQRAVANRTVVDLRTNRGNATFPVGAYAVSTTEDGPLARAGAPADESFVITRVDGRRTPNVTALEDVLSTRQAGETVPVELYRNGDRHVYRVTLDAAADRQGAVVGVLVREGYSGLVVDDFGLDRYPAEQFLAALDAPGFSLGSFVNGEFIRQVIVLLVLPFWSTFGAAGAYNFAGFTGPVTNFYVPGNGPLSFLGGGVFLLANLLFWTGWVNLNLGLFNCIPTFPLDGGHILRTSTEALVSRLPIADGRRLTGAITTSVTVVMLSALFLMVFGPQLLS
ncbi:MAG: site-2 protease family protein [Haloarculaceae archaeon]